MGVGLAIMGLSGIAIACDSMVNVGYSNVRYQSFLKLYPFGANDEFGLFLSGNDSSLGIPLPALIDDCNVHLKSTNLPLNDPTEAGQFLLDFFEPAMEYYQVQPDILLDLFTTYLDTVINIEIDIKEATETELIDVLSKLHQEKQKDFINPGFICLHTYFNKKDLAVIRTRSRKNILDALNLNVSIKVYNLMFDSMAMSEVYHAGITFNIAGFPINSPYPQLFRLRVFGLVDGRLLYNHEVINTSPNKLIQISIEGEQKFIDRFIGGTDFRVLDGFTSFYTKSLISFLEESDQDFSLQIDYLESLIPDLNEAFQITDVMPIFNNEEDFLKFLSGLSHQEILNITNEFVRMTILLSQYDFSDYRRAGQTGGDIILASIKKHQPFTYIKRGNL